MKQILQNLKTGETKLEEVPCPNVGRGEVLIKTRRTLISAGTERTLVEFSKGGLLAKAKAQPDKVKQVLDKIKTDGLLPTLETVFKRLDEPLPLGYCNVGEVIEVGADVAEFRPGDRVASNGPHAEIVCVPKNLCAKIPDGVSDDAAAFTVLSAIGLEGVRLTKPELGEKVIVFGAGLIGLVVVQLLRASGCAVMAIDLNAKRLEWAKSFGAVVCDSGVSDPLLAVSAWTDGVGVDAAIITASAKTDDIVHQAAMACRKRGRVVLVGVVGLNLRRADFYEKELSFQVSCSYGAGRYDDLYEQRGQDYPIGYVRWTEQRNFQAILDTAAAGGLRLEPLITDRIRLEDVELAYDKILNDRGALGVVLEFPDSVDLSKTVRVHEAQKIPAGKKAVVAMFGAGNFGKWTMGPALAKTGAARKYVVVTKTVTAARDVAKKGGFEFATSDGEKVWADPEVNAVFIATGHASHAELTLRALESGKHVFVEKPLAMNREELTRVVEASRQHSDLFLMVGFNRRFSPYVQKMKELLRGRGEPLAMHFAANAGVIPPNVWVHDPELGGGRIIGEACHYIDLLSYLAGSRIVSVASAMMGKGVAVREDKMSIVLSFEDGSIGTVNYFGNGSKSYPKETVEVYSEGRILRLDNFRTLEGYGFGGFKKRRGKMDKGHLAEFKAFVDLVSTGGEPLISLSELENVTLASFAAMESAVTGKTIPLD